MPQVTGTVERVSSKQLSSGLYHSFAMDGTWYRTGKKKPPIEAGYQVRFDFTKDQYGNQVDLSSLKFKEGEAPQKQQVNAGGGKDGYWERKDLKDVETQKKISYQAAMNTAIQIVNGGIDREFFKLPGGKKASFEAYRSAIVQEAGDLFRTYQSLSENYDNIMSAGEEVVPKEDDMSDFTGEAPSDAPSDDNDGWE